MSGITNLYVKRIPDIKNSLSTLDRLDFYPIR